MTSRAERTNLRDRLPLSSEERLLLLCSRLELTSGQRDELNALLEGPLNWDQILYKARWHLYTLVYHHLCGLENRDLTPPDVMRWLKDTYRGNVVRSLFFQAELRKLVGVLRDQGVPLILMKGAVLSEKIYGVTGLRPMADLDLLVPVAEVDRADSIVRSMGYWPRVDQQAQDELRARGRQLSGLVSEGKPVIVEIHAHLIEVDNPLRFDINGFWDRAVPTTLANVPALELSPEDMVTHLAINFFKDRRYSNYSALGQLCDIAEVTRYYGDRMNWSGFVSEVIQTRLSGPAFCGLYLARQLLDAPVPDSVIQALEPADFDPMDIERLTRHRILGDRWMAKALVDPRSRYSGLAIVMAMLRRVFPSKRYLVARYDTAGQATHVHYLYLRRLWEALPIALRFMFKPGELREDLAVDRWLHSLYGDQEDRGAQLGA